MNSGTPQWARPPMSAGQPEWAGNKPRGPLSRDLSDPGLVDHPAPERAAQPVLAKGRNELVTLDNDVAEAIGWASLTQQQRDDIIYDRAAAEGCENCGSIQCSGRCPERD